MQIQYFNNLRALACFLVILTHSALPALDESFGMFMAFFSLIGSPSSELFVTISASLLAPTKKDTFSFYKKRFSKLIGPFLFWSVIILLLDFYLGSITSNQFFTKLLLFPIKPVTGVYWFVYAICALYLIIPIISPWLQKSSKKELQFVLLLWLVTILLPFLNVFLNKNIYDINGNYYFILTYCGGYIGYLFLGVYLRKYPLLFKKKINAILLTLLLIIVGTVPVAYGYIFNREILKIAQENLSITSVLYVVAIFCFFQNFRLHSKVEPVFNLIAKYSFGIYLIHIIVVRKLVWYFVLNNRLSHPFVETPFVAISSLIICVFFVKIITYLPKSKYVIGV